MGDGVDAALMEINAAIFLVRASPSDFALENEVVTAPPVEMNGNEDDAAARGKWRWMWSYGGQWMCCGRW